MLGVYFPTLLVCVSEARVVWNWMTRVPDVDEMVCFGGGEEAFDVDD
jgi:hypothetical protein